MSRLPLREYPASALTVSAIRSSYQPSTSNKSGHGHGHQQSVFRGGSSAINGNDTAGGDDYDSRLPGVADPSGVYNILMTDSDMALTKRKFVKVSSVGEIEVTPDKIEFCIQIFSTKPQMSAAKESIRKRDDFLMLALKKLGIPPDGVSTTSMVKKYKLEDEVDADDDLLEMKILRDIEKEMVSDKRGKKGKHDDKDKGQELQETVLNTEKVKVVKELYVICDNLNQYMELFSIVNEKLDRQVTVSPPVIRITPENLQRQSQAAAKLAMGNAVEKAAQLLHSQKNLKATVGKLFYSVEDSLTITDIAEYHNINTSTAFESLNWKRNNKLITCRLTCLFEVNTVKNNRRAI